MRTLTVTLAALLAVACASGDAPVVEPDPTARELLDDNARFALSSVDHQLRFVAHLDRGDKVLTEQVALDLVMGEAYVTAGYDGELSLDALDLYVDDVVAGEKVISRDGLHLTGIHVHLARSTACHETEWAVDDESCFALATADVDFEWSLEVDGIDYGLGTQHVSGVNLSLALHRDDRGGLELELAGKTSGVFWSWAGIVEFADLDLVLRGSQMPLVW